MSVVKNQKRPVAKSNRAVLSLRFVRRHVGLTVLLLLVLAVVSVWAGVVIQEKMTIASEKVRFAQAEKDVDQLTRDIVAVTGPPLKATHDKSCSIPSADAFQRKTIGCSVFSDHYYEVDDENQATKIHQEIKGMMDGIWKFKEIFATFPEGKLNKFILPIPLSYDNRNYYEQINLVYTDEKAKMQCSFVSKLYFASSPPYEDKLINSTKNYTLNTSVRCGDDSSIVRYPLR